MGMIALPICLGVIIVVIIVLIIIGIYDTLADGTYTMNNSEKRCRQIITIVVGLVFIAGTVVGMFFWGKYYVDTYNDEYTETVYEKIYFLDRGTEVSGSFTLGSGSIEENVVYYFYIETDRGFQLKSLTAGYEEIYLVEDDTVTPRVNKIKNKGEDPYYVIYVPEGTIVRQFQG